MKNNQAILNGLMQAFTYHSSTIKVRQELTLREAIQGALNKLSSHQLPLGIEVDVDSISYMPVSAFTNCGFAVMRQNSLSISLR